MSRNYQDISQQEKLVPQAKSILRAMPMWKLQLGENSSKRVNFKSVTELSPQEEYLFFPDDLMYKTDRGSPSSVIDFLSKNLIIISSLIFLYLHTSGRGKRGFNFMQILTIFFK